MMSHVLKLVFLFLVAAPSISQSISNPCLYNREDVLPCEDHFNTGVVSPGTNQYTVHATRFQRHPMTGLPICVRRKEGELLRDVEDLGSPQVKFIFSPGAEQSPTMNYVNQILVEYNVSCNAGQPAFIQFEALDLEPKNCETKCRDYVEIDAGSGGNMEYCGNDLPSDPFLVGTGRFTLKLRTSFFTSFPGFRVFVTCVSTEGINPKTCTNYGGISQKRATLELVDLAPVQSELRLEGPSLLKPRPSPLTLTTADRKTLDSLAESLFNVALSQARRKITSWPPPSYSRNDPNDVRSLSELTSPTVHVLTRPPPTLLPPPPPPSLQPIFIDQPDYVLLPNDQLQPRRKRLSVIGSLSPVHLSSTATLNAVRNEEACNPIVRSVSTSYLTVAQRLEPAQLLSARQEFQQELALQP